MTKTTDAVQLRSVTSNFVGGLNGLRQVAGGVMILFWILALESGRPWNVWVLLPLMIVFGISCWRIGLYYEHRFGHVETHRRPWTALDGGSFIKRGLFWIPVALLYLGSEKLLHVNLRWEWFLGLLFVAFFLVEGRRWYYLLCSVPFFVFSVFSSRHDLLLLRVELWFVPVALITTGIIDHLLFVRSLRGVQSNGAA